MGGLARGSRAVGWLAVLALVAAVAPSMGDAPSATRVITRPSVQTALGDGPAGAAPAVDRATEPNEPTAPTASPSTTIPPPPTPEPASGPGPVAREADPAPSGFGPAPVSEMAMGPGARPAVAAAPATAAQSATQQSATQPAAPQPAATLEPAAAPGPTRRSTPRPPVGIRADTGLTRIRFEIESAAAWTAVTLDQTSIGAVRVVSTSGDMRVTSTGPALSVDGHGTAVIDTVLAITSGAEPVLSMCKNYLGPATVTVIRRTDDPVIVATAVNDGGDPNVPAGSCENARSFPIPRSALIGPVRFPARVDSRPLVLANYYPWYDAQALEHRYGDQPVGPANTDDPADVAAMVDLAANVGIDGFVVEYEGTPAHTPRIDSVYRQADRYEDFSAALTIDLDILASRSGRGLTSSQLDDALDAVADHAGAASQLRVGNRPVAFVYGARKADPSQWQSAIARLSSRRGVVPFIVADDANLGAPGRYEYGNNYAPSDDGLARWSADKLTQFRLNPALDGETGPLWVAPVSPGYDDTRLGRSRSIFVDRAGGQRYASEWRAALSTLPDWVIVTSWNEYFEQTHLMPGSSTGTRALEQTADYAPAFRSAS